MTGIGQERTRVGVAGLGTMGTPIAERLLAAGYRTTVWNRTAARGAALVEAGAASAASPAALARAAETVVVCVTDTAAVEDVVFGSDGIVAGAQPGLLLVDTSSIDPVATRDLARRFAAACGGRWVDAPVSGGEAGARAGSLIVLAGGEAGDVERARPVLAVFAGRITHLGPAGAGQAAKVCNQMIIGAEVAVIAEALRFAATFGLDARRLPEALAGGWADSTVLQNHGRRMAAGVYRGAAAAHIMIKDMELACAMGRASATPMPVTGLVAALYRLAIAQGHADAGQLAPMRLYADGPL